MYTVKFTSLDFGKMGREPIDFLIENGCEFESVQIDGNSEEQGIEVVKDADVLVVGLQRITKSDCSGLPKGSLMRLPASMMRKVNSMGRISR